VSEPFVPEAGLQLLSGNLGRAILKTSAVAPVFWQIQAQVRVFGSEAAVHQAYQRGELSGDLVLVVRFQGPRANGMPELHKLMPLLVNLQRAGQKVALLTDGRLSGASGQVLAALHLTPEAAADGPLARLQDGDWVHIDAQQGLLAVQLTAAELAARAPALAPQELTPGFGLGLFSAQRRLVGPADQGATSLDWG
jgi:phosphogluconate dehydratase